jgi:hypothetical protein
LFDIRRPPLSPEQPQPDVPEIHCTVIRHVPPPTFIVHRRQYLALQSLIINHHHPLALPFPPFLHHPLAIPLVPTPSLIAFRVEPVPRAALVVT